MLDEILKSSGVEFDNLKSEYCGSDGGIASTCHSIQVEFPPIANFSTKSLLLTAIFADN